MTKFLGWWLNFSPTKFSPDFFAPDQHFSPTFLTPTKRIWDKYAKFLCPFPTQIHALNWKLEGYIWTSGVNPFNLRDLVGEKWLIFKISRGKVTKIASIASGD